MQLIALTTATIMGVATVIDGDTIEIHDRRIRLHGVDAPESGQQCIRDGILWRCGTAAATALSDFVDRGTVRCEQTDTDRYKRIVARCRVNGIDINAWLVEQGWALDYSRYSAGEFAPQQKRAERAGRGIWASEFEPPWDWRKR